MDIKKTLLVFIFSVLNLLASPPSWAAIQIINGYICGVGISNDINPVVRERISVVSARAALAENISVEIISYFKIHVHVLNDKKTQVSESLIEQKAHIILSKSRIEKRFLDDDGTLYILVVLPRTVEELTTED